MLAVTFLILIFFFGEGEPAQFRSLVQVGEVRRAAHPGVPVAQRDRRHGDVERRRDHGVRQRPHARRHEGEGERVVRDKHTDLELRQGDKFGHSPALDALRDRQARRVDVREGGHAGEVRAVDDRRQDHGVDHRLLENSVGLSPRILFL